MGGVTLALLLALLGGLALFARPVLGAVGDYLAVADQPAPADLVFVHIGDSDSRAPKVAELLRGGFAKWALVPQAEDSPSVERGLLPNDTTVCVRWLKRAGIPANAIRVVGWGDGVTSTRDEAALLADWLEDHPARRVLVVTSRLHCRRTRWIHRKILRALDDPPEIRMVPAEHWNFDAEAWWESEFGLLFVVNEYIKLGYYWIKYG